MIIESDESDNDSGDSHNLELLPPSTRIKFIDKIIYYFCCLSSNSWTNINEIVLEWKWNVFCGSFIIYIIRIRFALHLITSEWDEGVYYLNWIPLSVNKGKEYE